MQDVEDKVLVTVLLTVYNRTDYLETALKSVLDQSMTNFEIIIADDSGFRLAEPIYKRYEHDTRIRYQPNPRNLGIVKSIKQAIRQSKGAFISFLNDDDCWEKEFLQKMSDSLLDNNDCVLAFSDHWIMDDTNNIDLAATDLNTRRYKRDNLKTGKINDPTHLTLVHYTIPLAMAAMFRKNAIDYTLLLPDASWAYDLWIANSLAATKKPFYYVNERLTRYRVHSQMETDRRAPDKLSNMIYIYKTFLAMNVFPAYTNLLLKRYSFWLYKFGRDQLYFGQFSTARQYFKLAIAVKFDYRPLVSIVLSYMPDYMLKKISFLARN